MHIVFGARLDGGALLFPELTEPAGFSERSKIGAVAGEGVLLRVYPGLWGGVGLTLRARVGPWTSSTRTGGGAVGAVGGLNSCTIR